MILTAAGSERDLAGGKGEGKKGIRPKFVPERVGSSGARLRAFTRVFSLAFGALNLALPRGVDGGGSSSDIVFSSRLSFCARGYSRTSALRIDCS